MVPESNTSTQDNQINSSEDVLRSDFTTNSVSESTKAETSPLEKSEEGLSGNTSEEKENITTSNKEVSFD